jgi:predicted house-cleaning noncanonical NTP pyrophosphatase (MazG superfamily)
LAKKYRYVSFLYFIDEEFKQKYEENASQLFNIKYDIISGNTSNMENINVREIEKAMQILLEGYKRVKKGESDVKLSDVLRSVNIEVPEFVKKDEPDVIMESEEKDYETFTTKSNVKLPSHYDTHKSLKNFINEFANTSSDGAQVDEVEEEQPDEEEEPQEEEEMQDRENVAEDVENNPAYKKFKEQIIEEYNDVLDEHIGRYLPGFRYYENYESYCLKHPERTIEDYYEDINREATLEEYIELHRTAARLTMRIVPHIRYRVLTVTDNRPERIEMMLESEEYTDRIKQEYAAKIKEFLSNKMIYKLIDCLEDHMELFHYGDMNKVPTTGIHIPNTPRIMPFHKFVKQIDDPQPLDTLKVGQNDFLNPFKSLPIQEKFPDRIPRAPKMHFNKKYRRMKGNRMGTPRLFSTLVSRVHHQVNHPIVYGPFIVKK